MHSPRVGVILLCCATAVFAQDSPQGPTDKKAQKGYQQALDYLQKHDEGSALWFFRDADKKDQGHCLPCQEQMLRLGLTRHDWKAVEQGASGLTSEVQEPKQQAVAHYYLGMALMHEGVDARQNDLINRAHDEFSKANSLYPHLPDILFEDGHALAQLHRDDEAKSQFEKYIAISPEGQFKRWRAFLEKNDVPGLQCMEGYNGPIAQALGVGIQLQSSVDRPIAGTGTTTAGTWTTTYGTKQDIPKTFLIDADGVFQEEKLSDSLDRRIQDLIASAGPAKTDK